MSIPNQYTHTLEVNKESPYFREMIPAPMFEGIWAQSKQMALGYLCQLDPSHAELYQKEFPLLDEAFEAEFFKQSVYEMFAGCLDPQAPMFQYMMLNSVAKMVAYGRFLIEKKLYKLQSINMDMIHHLLPDQLTKVLIMVF